MNTEQKTPIEWFQKLKEPYRSEAIANIVNPEYLANSVYDALESAVRSRYKHVFTLMDSIKAGETTYLETETELNPQDMISGEWYVVDSPEVGSWLKKFKELKGNRIYSYKSIELELLDYCDKENSYLPFEEGDKIRKATREEVLEHFPDEFQDENKEVESELKEGEMYFYSFKGDWGFARNLEQAIDNADEGSKVLKATPIGTKQTKSILEPIKK